MKICISYCILHMEKKTNTNTKKKSTANTYFSFGSSENRPYTIIWAFHNTVCNNNATFYILVTPNIIYFNILSELDHNNLSWCFFGGGGVIFMRHTSRHTNVQWCYIAYIFYRVIYLRIPLYLILFNVCWLEQQK